MDANADDDVGIGAQGPRGNVKQQRNSSDSIDSERRRFSGHEDNGSGRGDDGEHGGGTQRLRDNNDGQWIGLSGVGAMGFCNDDAPRAN